MPVGLPCDWCGGDFALMAEASDRDGRIAKVEFYASAIDHGRVRRGEAVAAPYQFTWKEIPPG